MSDFTATLYGAVRGVRHVAAELELERRIGALEWLPRAMLTLLTTLPPGAYTPFMTTPNCPRPSTTLSSWRIAERSISNGCEESMRVVSG